MNLPLYIAKRYLISRKKHNAINIISAISVCGVALATMAMVCTLSVFNGFHELVEGLFTAFDPQLRITVRQGKVFDPTTESIRQVKSMPEIGVWMESVEENALAGYKNRQTMVTIKGVEDSFERLTSIDSILIGNSSFRLTDEVADYCTLGIGVAETLGTGLEFVDPLTVYAPRRGKAINIANPASAFVKDYLYSSGSVFIVNQEKYDSHYIIVPLDFARSLFGYDNEVSSIEIRLKDGADTDAVQQKMQDMLGTGFSVQNRYEQQSDVYRIMEIEKLISFAFLTFIIIIASFNIISTLSMLMADKREDINTLHGLGADNRMVQRIFIFEGWLISAVGAIAGIIAGLLLCWAQQQWGLIRLGSDFIVEAYPVSVHLTDVLLVAITVMAVGFASVIYPVKFIIRHLSTGREE